MSINTKTNTNIVTLSFIIIAYTFSITVRYFWIYWASSHPEFFWNGQLMINASDGYLWAKAAKDILMGFEPSVTKYTTFLISKVTAFLVKILPFSFETIILWMPAFFSSLIVIPIILIGRVLNIIYVGFIAALIASIAWSYYNRTMIGFYDTDMLNVVLPTFIIFGLIGGIKTKKDIYLLITSFSVIFSEWWYVKSYALNMSIAFMFLIYIFIFEKDKKFAYKLLTFFLIGILIISPWIKILIAVTLYIIFHYFKEKIEKFITVILFIMIGAVLYSGGFDLIIFQIKRYIFKEAVANDIVSLHYKPLIKTVGEAVGISFNDLGKRVIGDSNIFILSLIGYLLLVMRFPVMIIFLPMLAFGFLGSGIKNIIPSAGLRFTIYATPASAFGISYLFFAIGDLAQKYIKNIKNIKNFIIIIFTLIVIYPNIKHVISHKISPIVNRDEVFVLNNLKKIVTKNDYIISWWDYGYYIKYYTGANTLVDGGRNFSSLIYLPSFILTKDQISASNMARLSVEYATKYINNPLFHIIKHYKFNSIDEFFKALKKTDFPLPPKTKEAFIYLPLKTINILYTIFSYSNFDLVKGVEYPKVFLKVFRYIEKNEKVIDFGNGMKLSKKNGTLIVNGNKIPIKLVITTKYDNNIRLRKRIQEVYPNGSIYVIYMQSYNLLLLMDEKVFNSLYIQLFVLDNYNPNLFEPIVISPWAKVYKVKR